MSVQSNIFAEFTSLVEKAAFVTVDTELSGLTEDRNNITSLDEYLLLLRDGVTTYSMLQVGFCLAVYCSSTPNGKWMLYPYNFYVYPSDDCVMHLRSSTVTWLHAQGFNFMRWISEGRGYRRLECEASTSGRSKRQKKVNRYGLQRYLEVIKKHNKPLVVHNGLLDLLHLYDKFIGVIPELPGDICNALYTKLGPGIYDTKYVSRTLQSLGIQETLKVNSLETIYRYYDELVKFGSITEICDTESHLNYSKCFSKTGMSKLALVHEAGFDALLTARVFAGQISLITKADSLPPDYVPVHSDDPTDMGTTLSAVINRVNIHDQIGIDCLYDDLDRRMSMMGFYKFIEISNRHAIIIGGNTSAAIIITLAVLSAIRGQTVDRRHFDGRLDHGFVPQPEHRVDYTSVRRYNVDFCPIYSSPEGIVQPGGSNLKLYVVSRRNSLPGFQSYLPFDVFTQLNHSHGGQEQSPGGQRDIFDCGISSSDDGTEFGGSPYLTPKSVGKRLDSTRSSIQREVVSPHVQYTPVASVSDTRGFHQGTVDTPNVVSSTVVPDVVISSGNLIAPPQQSRKKTISGRHAIEHLSPTGYSPFASFGNIYANGLKEQTGADIPAAPDVNIAKSEVLKKRRGRKPKDAAKRDRKKHVSLVPDMVPIDSEPLPLRIADASVLDTSTDYVHSPGTKAVPHVSTAMMPLPPAVGDTTSIHRISDHVDLRRLSNGNISLDIGGHTGAESIDNRSDANVQTNAIDAGRLSLAVGSDAIDMGEYATLEDHVRRGSLGGPNKRPRQRVAKDSISSAMLLNSWYISYVNKGDKKRARRAAVEDAVVSDDRPRRYPTRNRLPPIQHWNSNFHEDGSSVLFLVGVTSSDDTKLNQSLAPSDLLSDDGNSPVGSPVASRMQPRKIPDASLVLSDSGGTMDVHLVESSAERYLPITNHVSGRDDIAILPLNSRGERTREPRSDIDLRAIEDVRTGKSIPKSVRKPAKRVAGTRKSTDGRKKERREMTVGEAWDILLTEDHVTSDDVSEIQERPKVAKRGRPKASTVSTASLTTTEKVPTQSASHPRGIIEPDSEAFDRGRLFSYNSLFRVDRAPIHAHHGSLFQPLVMNKRCRTSHVVIPKGKNVQMGNVKGNFITGYLYTGDRVCIRSLGTHWPVEPGRAFFLPIYEEWALYNESETHDAILALIFVTIQ